MIKHPDRVLAEFREEGSHGVANWTGTITHKRLAQIQAIERGTLEFGECYGKPQKDYHRSFREARKRSFRVLSDRRGDVMAFDQCVKLTGRPHFGNVDFLSAVADMEEQNREEEREMAGEGGDSEPEDGEDLAELPLPPTLARMKFVNDALNECEIHSPAHSSPDTSDDDDESSASSGVSESDDDDDEPIAPAKRRAVEMDDNEDDV